jgi:uncharacterized protein (DUF2252 family)
VKVIQLLKTWSAKQPDPAFFSVLDVAHRMAGTGSLGRERYVILVEGKGSPNQNYLLDLKAASPSSLQPYVTLAQPPWSQEAERIITVQQRLQGMPPALLSAIEQDGRSYVLRELQPLEDRVEVGRSGGKLGRLKKVARTMGELTAWAQLRSSGRQGSDNADALIQFGKETQWQKAILNYAQAYAQQVEADHREFKEALTKDGQGSNLLQNKSR